MGAMVMKAKQIDLACFRIDDLILGGTLLADLVAEAQRIVQVWRTESSLKRFVKAVTLFQFHMQSVADEIEMRIPSIERLEREGFALSVNVSQGIPTSDLPFPFEGAVVKAQEDVVFYQTIAAALESAIPRHIQSLESLLTSDSFLGPFHCSG
jgi:hypothetical protein